MGCDQYPCSVCNTSYYSCWARCNMCGCDFDNNMICYDCIKKEQYERYFIIDDDNGDDGEKFLLLCQDCINKDVKQIQRVYDALMPLDELINIIEEHKCVYYNTNWLKFECILKIQQIKDKIDGQLDDIDILINKYFST